MPEPKAKAKTKAGAQSDDDEPEITDMKLNDSTDMEEWKQQSNNELHNQLKLRYPNRYFKEWAFKSFEQTIEIIDELIKNNQWALIEKKDRTYWENQPIPMVKGQIVRRRGHFKGAKLKKVFLEVLFKIMKI